MKRNVKVLSFMLVFVIFASFVGAPVFAAPMALPQCSIKAWNPGGVSGGCTCYVAEKVKAATGRDIPWAGKGIGDAGRWWGNAATYKMARNEHEPRKGAIVAFSYGSYGHVAYVDSVVKISQNQPVKVQTKTYITYLAFPFLKRTATATLYSVTETYTVYVSQRDYNRILKDDNSLRNSSWQATKTRYYWERDLKNPLLYWSTSLVGPAPVDKWNTPRTTKSQSGSNGLQGYIYP